MQFMVVKPAASPAEFVAFWAPRYRYPEEELYTKNIGADHTDKSLEDLFRWKIGKWLFKPSESEVKRNFISRLEVARKLATDRDPKRFLEEFSTGGAIWRIFWLHCWNQEFPIYDQHVHRAMTFIEEQTTEELGRKSDDQKIGLYLDRYIPFLRNFDGINTREVDKALFSFGKFLKAGPVTRATPA
jgi:hypothetical protein